MLHKHAYSMLAATHETLETFDEQTCFCAVMWSRLPPPLRCAAAIHTHPGLTLWLLAGLTHSSLEPLNTLNYCFDVDAFGGLFLQPSGGVKSSSSNLQLYKVGETRFILLVAQFWVDILIASAACWSDSQHMCNCTRVRRVRNNTVLFGEDCRDATSRMLRV